MAREAVLISAIVVTLNASERLLAALASLDHALGRAEGATEIIVVFNGDSDAGARTVRARFPDVRLVQLSSNRGFAGGVNAGLDASTGEWALLLNDDATIASDAVTELLAAGRDRPDVGSLAAQMRFARGGMINSAGLGVDRLGVAFDRHVGEAPDTTETRVTEVFGASGGASLIRRAMLDDIGALDDSFFMYLEDVDLAWRAQMRGWSCLYVPRAVVIHHHSGSSIHGSDSKYFSVGCNRVRLLAKHLPVSHLLRFGPAILAYDIAYVASTALTDRTLAPLRGRLSGVRQWRTYRSRGRDRRPVALAPVQGPGRALARRRNIRAGTAGLRGRSGSIAVNTAPAADP